MPNIAEKLKEATVILQKCGIREPSREAASLLVFALGKDRTFLIVHPEYQLSIEEETGFQKFLQRRTTREPFQYITGNQEFYGLDFMVTPDVLIPRPETELIVENAIKLLPENAKFCEVGVGSGCISIAILHNVKTATGVGLDISENALQIAEKNARRHQVSDRLQLKKSDVFEGLKDERFDLIISNPPYISFNDFEVLQPEVHDFEPMSALTDGKNGLSIIAEIIKNSPEFLKPQNYLLMEIGFGQAIEVKNMFAPKIWETIEILPDLQNIPRMVKALKK